MKEKQSAFDLARVLAVLGGLLTVVSGVQDILSLAGRRNMHSLEVVTNAFIFGIIVVGLGLVGVLGSRQVKTLTWNIVLIVVGLLAYQFDGGFPWFFGPLLVVLAGIVGIAAKLA